MTIHTVLLCVTLIGVSFVHADEPVTHAENMLQELKKQIDQADAQVFKALMGMTIIPENGTAIMLLNYAQEKRNALQQQHASLPDNAKEYKYLAKGVGQYYLGLCCGLGSALATVVYASIIMERKLDIPTAKQVVEIPNILRQSRIAFPAVYVACPIGKYIEIKDFNGNELSATAAYVIPTVLAYFGAKYFCRFGKENIKLGWNYKTHLEQQIKNLDEIITHIQNPTIAPAIKEQV